MAASANRTHLLELLHKHAEPLPQPHEADLGARFDRFGDAQIVLLGEATHGTAEFYQARAAITQHLIEHHGFRIVAVEADWPDAAYIDRYIGHRAVTPFPQNAFRRFPSWMWRSSWSSSRVTDPIFDSALTHAASWNPLQLKCYQRPDRSSPFVARVLP